ncbi:MAG: energy-coupling factor ABC transporter permease [Anaerolineales bacterium]|nr:energy-coupling factor ABC transporter permease [Anaerolineales bacterium]
MLYSPTPLHIPDGFLSLVVSLICWIISALIVAAAVSRVNRSLDERKIPLMGVMAAFIFAAQMINFPVAGGTSGHLLGGALAAIMLGPWAGILTMTAVIAVQGLLFQDGGLLTMGANILNMGLITAAIGYGFYRLVSGRSSKTVKLSAAGIAAWLSVMAAAFLASLQLWLSGTSPLRVVIPAMLGVHALIGLGEALITVFALGFIFQTRPDLLDETQADKGGKTWAYVGGAIALFVVLLSPFASADPDGLERVAEDSGFLHAAQSAPYQIIPDYAVPFLGQTALSTIAAGAAGVVVVAAIVVLVARGLKAKP